MKNALPLVLLLLALPLAYSTSSASFSTGAASLPENVGMDGHFGNYTLVAFSSAGKVTVAIYGAGESPSALASEIEWLAANEKFYTVCDIDAMPAPAYGQEAYCDANGSWGNEGAKAPSPRSAIMHDNGMGIAATGMGAPSEKTSDASLAQQEGVGIVQMLQLLGAFLAVLVASYLILQGRQEPSIDAAAEKLLSHPTRAGIMEELAASDKIPTDISARLGKSKAAVVEHLQALAGAGLVERVATPGKKFVFYKLTQKGRQALLRRAG